MRFSTPILFSVLLTLLLTTTIALSQNVNAQTSKPKLVEVTLSKNNSNSLLKIAESLNPDLFYIEDGFIGEAKHYASYLPLDSKNKRRFFAVTVTDTTYFCTSYGCPTYIYESIGENKWKQVLSVQAHALYYDLNTSSTRPDNIISLSTLQGNKDLSVWLWDGLLYRKAESK